MKTSDGRNLGLTLSALAASSATLLCCVLPAVLVSLGAGAAMVTLITLVPQLVWLSEHKVLVFGTAALLLGASGAMLWRARHLPCPIDPVLARSCQRMRRVSRVLYFAALAAFALGAIFAFLLPALLD